jgi:hypothetical protein
MRIIVFDIEVFRYDWIVVFFDVKSGEWTVYHNDAEGVREFMEQPDIILCGFNNKHYDNHIIKAICCGAPPELVKQLNDFIIVEERSGWEYWFLKLHKFWFKSFDLMDDTQVGTSLKHIEAHSNMPIVESEVDFNLDRPLTPQELADTVSYCKTDVLNTAKLLTMRKGYLSTKLNVGRKKGIPDDKALYMTNARLTAEFLDAKPVKRYDERDYHYPDNLDKSLIPPEVLEFFDRIHDESISDKDLFSSKLEFNIGECAVVVGFGGIHAAIPNFRGGN